MAEPKFSLSRYYRDLSRLFKSGPIQKQKIASKIAAPGSSPGQPVGTARSFLSDTNAMYNSLVGNFSAYSRMARFSDFEEMEQMPEISAALDLYAEEACAKDEKGKIFKIKSTNSVIQKTLNQLFGNILNLEFDAATWIRSFCKYGDCFLLVDHHPDYGVLGLYPLPVNEIEREEGFDKENPLAFRFRWTTKGNKVLENWQILHLRMPGNDRYHPYGASVIDAARRPYRQITLLEDAVMVYRIVRAPERRAFYIGVGNTAPQDIPAFMEKVKNQLKTNSIVGSDGKIDYRFNALNVLEDYFLPTRGEGDGTRIDPLPGGQFVGDIEDLTYIQNKLFAALKIPKSYLGYEEGVGKATLTQEDVRFARTIQKIQRVLIAELNKVAIIHLFSMGFSDDELFNFEITMANPSTVGELQKLELWRTRLEVASMAQENTFDKTYIWKELFNLNDEEIESIKEGLKKDRLLNAELDSVTSATMPASPEVDGADSVDASGASSSPPEAGLPPPPGEEAGNVEKNSLETASRDPMKQVAAPNELLKPFVNKKEKALNPNLFNYATNTKKTALDPKRQYSELMRASRAPFGETKNAPDDENYEDIFEKINNKNLVSNKKFVQSLENSESFKVTKSKKVLSD